MIALLVAALLVASTIAIVEFVQLRAANERIEELESGSGDGDGGLFGDFDDLIEDLLGEAGGLFEGAGEIGSLIECLGTPFGGSGEAGTSVEAIARQVEGIRELEFTRDVKPRFLSDREMNERVRELFLEEYTPGIADVEERILTALGAIPPGTDLRALRSEAIGQQVAGFYQPETGELVVRQSGSELSAVDRITLAHELDHALTDQVLGIPLPDDPELGSEDSSLAALALVEGDATLVMQRYSVTLGLDEQLGLLDPETIAASEAGLSGFSPYLEQELLFPYEQGLSFVCELYANGGWSAVDRAYDAPPATTAEVLFPERYLEGFRAENPTDPGALSGPWRRRATVQLGAANLLWLFSAPGGTEGRPGVEDPLAAARAWSGGELELWVRGPETAVGVSLSERPGQERLCVDVAEWYGSSFQGDQETGTAGGAFEADGERQDAVVACTEDQVRLGIAPDLRTARALVR